MTIPALSLTILRALSVFLLLVGAFCPNCDKYTATFGIRLMFLSFAIAIGATFFRE